MADMKVLRILDVSEIIGGILVLLSISLALTTPTIPLWHKAFSFILGIYAVVAGTLVWRRIALGQWLSLVLQSLQLFQISTNGLLIKVIVGLHVSIFMFQKGGLHISPGINGSFGVWGTGHTERLGIGINVLAFVSLLILVKYLTARPVFQQR